MYYVKVATVAHEDAVAIINDAMTAQELSHLDLVKLLRYPFQGKGIKDLELYFSGQHPYLRRLQIRIGEVLNIDHEKLNGERAFEIYEDSCRFDFKPYLVRVPEETRPNQITFFGLVGFERVFVVGRYKELLNRPIHQQLAFIKNKIAADKEKTVMFFGRKIGFSFYYDYDQPAIPLSLSGKVLEDMEIMHLGASCRVSMKKSEIAESGYFQIPRITQREKNADEEIA